MNEAQGRVWKKIAVFYTLTMLFSGVFDAFVLHAGKMDAGNFLYVTGAMWSPALAAFATKRIFRERIGDLPWSWSGARYAWLAYIIPIGYALAWVNLPPSLVLALFVLLTATLGMIGKMSRALGEEIGWRGFLVPELSKVVGFSGTAVISGLMWAVYHYPILLFADYNAGTPAWYGLICFTIMVVASSFILTWLTLRSGSLWPAAIFHGSHNLFIQSILSPLTKNTGITKYIIDEFGIGLVITTLVGAIIVWRRRLELPQRIP